jgi:hypothetical protein
MSRRVSNHIRSNVVGYLALFFVLTMGTAYATHPGGANTIGSGDIINGEVRNDDLAANAVGSAKIADRSVKNADLSIGASSSNTIADGGIKAIDVQNNTLTGAQVDESTLATVPSAFLANNAEFLDGVDSSGFQETGASGVSTGGGGTVTTTEESVAFPVAGGTFAYLCFGTNAYARWGGPQAEIWLDNGGDDPSHFNTASFEGAIDTNDGDRYTYVFTTADVVSELEIYSHSTATDCHYAYNLSEYER